MKNHSSMHDLEALQVHMMEVGRIQDSQADTH